MFMGTAARIADKGDAIPVTSRDECFSVDWLSRLGIFGVEFLIILWGMAGRRSLFGLS